MNIIQNLVPESKYNIKCPYEMTAEFIVVHNTANDATARNEIAYMISNNSETSFHYAIDDKEIVQGLPENRNGWHASDGGQGAGNRKGIAIEICYSESGGERFIAAEKLAAKFIAFKLNEKGWGIGQVKKHQDFCSKYCPHRTLNMGWQRFLDMIQTELNALKAPVTPENSGDKKTQDTSKNVLYRVQVGAYSVKANAEKMAAQLKAAGYPAIIKEEVVETETKVETKPVVSETKPTEPVKKLEAGSIVRVKHGAPDYTGTKLKDFVYNRNHTVKSISGNRVVITFNGVTVAAVHKDNLILV